MSRRNRNDRQPQQWSDEINTEDGDTIDADYRMYESRGCGGWRGGHHGFHRGFHRGPGRILRFVILAIIIGAIVSHMQGRHRVEAFGERIASVPPIALVGSGQNYFEDVTVASGETHEGDLVVYSGNALIESGGTVEGDLVLFSGNAEIRAGGVVEGDLTVWSGNVTVNGTVEGDIAAMSGNVTLGSSAEVEGDVSTFSGNLNRSPGATIDGDVVSGFSKGGPFWSRGWGASEWSRGWSAPEAPVAPAAPFAPGAAQSVSPSTPNVPDSHSLIARFFFLMGRLILGLIITVAITLLSVGIFSLRPASMTAAHERMRSNMRGSFALGVVVNFVLYLASFALFRIGFCFAPIAVIFTLGLVVLTVGGYNVSARHFGGKVLAAFNRNNAVERKPVMEVAAGAFALAGIVTFLAALVAQWWVFSVGMLLVAAPGVGALVAPWFEKVRNRNAQDLTSPGPRPSTPSSAFGSRYPMPAAAAATATTASAPVKPYAPARPVQPAQYGTAAPASPWTVEEIPVQKAAPAADTSLSAVESAPATARPASDSSPWVLEAPQTGAPVAPYSLTLPDVPAPQAAGTPSVTVEDLVRAADADRAAADAVKAAEVAARDRAVDVSIGDDLTKITGLGKSSERKLKGAGIVTYAQLAAVPVEMIATILGVPVEEVIEDEVVKQAHALAGV